MSEPIVIVGAGHAGGSAAALLRQYGFEGPIVLAGEEPLAPYQRPPLSKAWLKGEADGESLLLRPFEFYAEHNIELRLGAVATARCCRRPAAPRPRPSSAGRGPWCSPTGPASPTDS